MSDKCVCSVQKFKNGQGKWTLLGFIFSPIIKILKYLSPFYLTKCAVDILILFIHEKDSR